MNLSQITDVKLEKQLKKMTAAQVENAIQSITDEIRRYKKGIENYPADRMEKYGKPHLAKLEARLTMTKSFIK